MSVLLATSLLTACRESKPSSPVPEATATIAPVAMPTPTSVRQGQRGAQTIGDPRIPYLGNGGYDVQRYVLALRIDPSKKLLSGTTTIEALSTLDALEIFSLDFVGGYEVTELKVDGVPATFWRSDNKLFVQVPKPLLLGTRFETAVAYQGEPQTISSPDDPFGLGFRFKGDRAWVLAEPDGARTWFPANDHPMDKALFRFEITVPNPLVAVANGQPQKPIPGDGVTTYTWEMDSPMATYLALVSVGQYHLIFEEGPGGIPLRHYVEEELLEKARPAFAPVGAMLSLFSSLFAPYPFHGYGHVVVAESGIGMETQTMTMLAEDFIAGRFEDFAESVIAHELAHQWFGDYVSIAAWDDIWLNEGFASYAEALWVEHTRGEAGLDDAMLRFRTDALRARSVSTPVAAPDPLFGNVVYSKGAWVLHMLRMEVGDDAFFRMLKEHVKRHGDGTTTTEEFVRLAEEVSGRDLDTFFQQWLHRPGYPQLEVRWIQERDKVELQLCQRGNSFAVPLTLRLVGRDGRQENISVNIQGSELLTAASVPFSVVSAVADPGVDLLAGITVKEEAPLVACGL